MAGQYDWPAMPAGTAFYYRASDLSGVSIVLYQDVHLKSPETESYLRGAGAKLHIVGCENGYPLGRAIQERKEMDGFDIGIIYASNPRIAATILQQYDFPFIIFTHEPERCLSWYPAALCAHTEDGPEALASSILLQLALRKGGFDSGTVDIPLIDWVPRLRAMARFLVKDHDLADEIIAAAMIEAIRYVDTLDSDREIGALLVLLVERIWHREKMSRLS